MTDQASYTTTPPQGNATPDIHVTGRRAIAAVLDILFIAIAGALIGAFFGALVGETGEPGETAVSDGTYAFASLVLMFVNFAVIQGNTGQSPAKILLKIKVIDEASGEAPGVGSALFRTVLLFIDGLFLYLVGFLTILGSSKNRRLGDMAASTLVVRA